MKPEHDGARPGLENFQQKIIVDHIDLDAEHAFQYSLTELLWVVWCSQSVP